MYTYLHTLLSKVANLLPSQREVNNSSKSTTATKVIHTDYYQWLWIRAKGFGTATRSANSTLPCNEAPQLLQFYRELLRPAMPVGSGSIQHALPTVSLHSEAPCCLISGAGLLKCCWGHDLSDPWLGRFCTFSIFYFLIYVKSSLLLVCCHVPIWSPASTFPSPDLVFLDHMPWVQIFPISKEGGMKLVLQHHPGIQHHVTRRAGLVLTWVTSLVSDLGLFWVLRNTGEWLIVTLQSFRNKTVWGYWQRGPGAGVPHCPL